MNKGFTILELMVAAGLVGIVSLGVLQITKDSEKISKTTGQTFEVQQLTNSLSGLFSTNKVCKATLFNKNPSGVGEPVLKVYRTPTIDDIKVYRSTKTDTWDSENIDPEEVTQHDSLIADTTKTQIILRADCPATGTTMQKDPCSFGVGTSAKVFLKKLTILGFGVNGPNQATLKVELQKGIVDQTFELPISVSLDANSKITNCAGSAGNYSETSCAQIGGFYDTTDRRCKNLFLNSDATHPQHPFALATIGQIQINGLFSQENGYVLLDSTAVPTAPGGSTIPGSLIAEGHSTIGSNTIIQNGQLYFGPYGSEVTKVERNGNNILKISQKNTPDEGGFIVGNVPVNGKASRIGINKIPSLATLDINGTAHFSSTLDVMGNSVIKNNLYLKNGPSNQETISAQAGRLLFNGANVQVTNSTYNGTTPFATQIAGDNTLLANQAFVNGLFVARIGPTGINTIVNNIITNGTTVAGGRLDNVMASTCSKIKYAVQSGTNCIMMGSAGSCSGTNFFGGWNASGNIICQTPLSNINCAAGEVLVGINANGTPICSLARTVMQPTVDRNWLPAKRCTEKLAADPSPPPCPPGSNLIMNAGNNGWGQPTYWDGSYRNKTWDRGNFQCTAMVDYQCHFPAQTQTQTTYGYHGYTWTCGAACCSQCKLCGHWSTDHCEFDHSGDCDDPGAGWNQTGFDHWGCGINGSLACARCYWSKSTGAYDINATQTVIFTCNQSGCW